MSSPMMNRMLGLPVAARPVAAQPPALTSIAAANDARQTEPDLAADIHAHFLPLSGLAKRGLGLTIGPVGYADSGLRKIDSRFGASPRNPNDSTGPHPTTRGHSRPARACRRVVDGLSPNRVRYITAKRPSSVNPYRQAISATFVRRVNVAQRPRHLQASQAQCGSGPSPGTPCNTVSGIVLTLGSPRKAPARYRAGRDGPLRNPPAGP